MSDDQTKQYKNIWFLVSSYVEPNDRLAMPDVPCVPAAVNCPCCATVTAGVKAAHAGLNSQTVRQDGLHASGDHKRQVDATPHQLVPDQNIK